VSERLEAARANAAAAGTLAALHLALRDRLEAVAYGFPLYDTKSGTARMPVVIDGWLPPKKNTGDSSDDQFPFLILRPRTGVDSPQGADQDATATLEIIVGTYSDTDDGWLDVMFLIDAIRDDLNAEPAIRGTAFHHVGPLSWQIPEEQPRPQWFGTINTVWQLPRAERVEARNPTTED
jgi:hypothetical protein